MCSEVRHTWETIITINAINISIATSKSFFLPCLFCLIFVLFCFVLPFTILHVLRAFLLSVGINPQGVLVWFFAGMMWVDISLMSCSNIDL